MGFFDRLKKAAARVVRAVASPFEPPKPAPQKTRAQRRDEKAFEKLGVPDAKVTSWAEVEDARVKGALRQAAEADLPAELVDKLSRLKWDESYLFTIKVIGYQGKVSAATPDVEHTITHVATLRAYLPTLFFLASATEVLSFDAQPLAMEIGTGEYGTEIRPLWATDSITLKNGNVVWGVGRRSRLKTGRKREPTGRSKKDDFRRKKKNAQNRKYRAQATQKRIEELEKTNPKEAEKLRRRSAGQRRNK